MSENVTPESEAARLYRHCRRAIGSNEPASYDCPHPDVDDVEAVIAAAEERGFRRGVERTATALRNTGYDHAARIAEGQMPLTQPLPEERRK